MTAQSSVSTAHGHGRSVSIVNSCAMTQLLRSSASLMQTNIHPA